MTFFEKLIYKFFGGKLSYSQCGEDIIINHILKTYHINHFTYLDIGTNHPKKANNTYKFYSHGHYGVCVEPNLELVKLIKKIRPNDKCLNVGVSIEEDKEADFYIMNTHTLSTFSKTDAEQFEKEGKHSISKVVKVKLKNINNIIHENFNSCPEIVSIDVEGLNEEIVLSFDFNKYRPTILCLETITYSDNNTGIRLNNIIDFLIKNNYTLYADTNINSIFIDNNIKSNNNI